EKEILPENYVQAAISSHSVVGPGLPSEDNPDIYFANYGYGWFLSSYKGHYRVEHGGNIDGFSANAAFYPTDKIGIVVLSNQTGSPVPSLVRNTISDRMLNEERRDWAEYYLEQKKKGEKAEEEAKTEDSSRIENTSPSHPLVGYTGKYANPGYGDFNITLENDSLIARFKLKTLFLQHHHYDIFKPMEVTSDGIEEIEEIPLMFNFRTNIAGDISSVYIKAEPALDELEFKRTPPSIKIEESELAQYTGEYDLGGMKIKIYTKGNVLYAFVPGQPEYELIATEKHKFSFKALEGFKLEFVESNNGKINEVKVIQPNGTFTAKR
ncbi:MAG: DUF3471 domain-containing protein, partial [Flavobacteriaceae bacterium]|nr:DUF3471 domain-containing protein [Flavobacteriaceae bacterium]